MTKGAEAEGEEPEKMKEWWRETEEEFGPDEGPLQPFCLAVYDSILKFWIFKDFVKLAVFVETVAESMEAVEQYAVACNHWSFAFRVYAVCISEANVVRSSS